MQKTGAQGGCLAKEIYHAPFVLEDPSSRLSEICHVRQVLSDTLTAALPNDDFAEWQAKQDFDVCLYELNKLKPYKCVPPWGLPRELWIAAFQQEVLGGRISAVAHAVHF